jgi:UDP-2,4-diacetamido-2,4,6-trideoxy-beta-L-altropyranose hydrolase
MLPGALLICRADADQEICTGHVMRAIALGEAWRRAGGRAALLTKCEPWLQQRAAGSFAEVHALSDKGSVEETLNAIQHFRQRLAPKHCWVSLDGYHFDDVFQGKIKALDYPLLVFDDYAHLPHYSADIILNQNAGAELLDYHTERSKLLLGTDYVILRDEFLSAERAQIYEPNPKRILVTMGGVDSPNVTQVVLEALAGIESEHVSIRILIGRANPHLSSLKSHIRSHLPHAELIVQADNMSEQYQWSTMAIAAAGTTSWELCYFGIPSLLVQIADNQRALAVHLAQTEAAIDLGWFSELSSRELKQKIESLITNNTLRQKMSECAKKLVDGRGGVRLIQEMKRLSNAVAHLHVNREFVHP